MSVEPLPIKARLRDLVYEADARMEVKAVLYALIHHADARTLACFPSIPTIARGAGMDPGTARGALALLVACGAVSRRDRAEGRMQLAPEWTLHEKELLERLATIPKPKRGGKRTPAPKEARTPKHDPTPKQGPTPPPKQGPTPGAKQGGPLGPNMADEPRQRTPSFNPVIQPLRGGEAPSYLPDDLDALMPEAGVGFALTLLRAGIETPEQLLGFTQDQLAHSRGIGHATAAKVVRELAKGSWRLRDSTETVPAWKAPAVKAQATEAAWASGSTGDAEVEAILRGEYDDEWRTVLGMTDAQIAESKAAHRASLDRSARGPPAHDAHFS